MKNKTILYKLMLLIPLLVVTGLYAQSGSVATADDYTAAKVNPAALNFGNAAGIAFEGFYDEDGTEDRYKIFFNTDTFAFVYGKEEGFNSYRISTSFSLAKSLYIGSDIFWVNSVIRDADYSVSSLFRPNRMLSFGLSVRDVNRSNPGYHLGLGIRPLAGLSTLSDRLTFTGDISYTEKLKDDVKEVSWNKPVIGVETELFNGVRLAGNYNLETETLSANFSLAFNRVRWGSSVEIDDDNEFIGGKYYLFYSKKDHRSLPNIFARDIVYEFPMRREIVDEKERRRIGPFVMSRNQITMEEIIERIRTLKEDDSIKGIIFRNPNPQTNYANLMELRKELLEFKEAGKKIIVYGDNFGNLLYAFFASVADVMYLNPNGSVNLIGFSIAVPYFAETLDKLGIDVYDMRSHDYKTGLNIFTENEMTDAEEETFSELLDDFYYYMVKMLEEGRGEKLKGSVDYIINNGPYLIAKQAQEAGLVDHLIYEDEIEEAVKELFKKPNITKEFPREKMLTEWAEPKAAKIAVIQATGSITMSNGQPGRIIGGKTTARQIKKAREDKRVKGIIIRVNSGGGSAYASDLIAREVKKCREEGKPVVVSMGGAAASGGYYIAAYADRIVAEPTTITGSIGVTGMLPNFNRLFDKILVRWSAVKRGDNADLFAIYRPLEEEEISLLRTYILNTYDNFVNVVAEGRGMSYEEVHRIGQGRVWTGRRALDLGLVDELGGMQTAIEVMKEIGNFEKVRIEDYSYTYHGFSLGIINIRGIFESRRELLQLPEEIHTLMEYQEMQSRWGDERALYLMPLIEMKGLE